MRTPMLGILLFTLIAAAPMAWGQATARPCTAEETAGPACLLSRQPLPLLPAGPLYWHLEKFVSRGAAEKAATATSTVVDAFGSVWLFTIERRGWRSKQGTHVSSVGPLPAASARIYAADYLRSVFRPGMTAPLHVHSGPEAFYALSGDTCLETPDGVQLGRGSGNALLVKGGLPMLLMAIGKAPRRGFALILHDAGQPPTTLIHNWQAQGLCQQALAAENTK